MVITGAVLLDLLWAYCMYAYLEFRKKEQKTLQTFFHCSWNKKRALSAAGIAAAAFLILLYGLFKTDTSWMQCYINMSVFHLLAAMAYIDLKEKIIPNQLILVGIILWLIVALLEIIVGGTVWSDVLLFSLLGGGICGGILLIIALVSKSALGMGDVKLFFVIGLLYGFMDTYSILLFTVILMALISVILLIMKKVTAKTAIPMAPFVVFGFLIGILAGM